MLRKASLSVMVFTYFFAGLFHFTRFEYYLTLAPSFLPYPAFFTRLSGLLFILLAVLLLFRSTRKMACYILISLLVFVSVPMNLFILLSGGAGIPLPFWELACRIPFHLVLALWAYWQSRIPKEKD